MPKRTHGKSGDPVYAVWAAMIQRCQNPSHKNYARYGGRGIAVCERWQSFHRFYADMGDRPAGSTLDRIDNDGSYSPDNCRWTSQKNQLRNMSRNRIVEIGGESKCLSEWLDQYGVNWNTYKWRRYTMGYDEITSITTPVRKGRGVPRNRLDLVKDAEKNS